MAVSSNSHGANVFLSEQDSSGALDLLSPRLGVLLFDHIISFSFSVFLGSSQKLIDRLVAASLSTSFNMGSRVPSIDRRVQLKHSG